MTEFSTDEVVRQSLRSLVQELAMGLLPSKDDTKNDKKQRLVQAKAKGYTRSAEFLKKLYENPSRYLGKVLNNVSTRVSFSWGCVQVARGKLKGVRLLLCRQFC